MSENKGRKISPVRKAAEFVTLGISLILILGLAGFLVWQGLKPHPKFVKVEARPLLDLVEKNDNQYIVPIEIANKGSRTLREIVTEVEFVSKGKTENREVIVDYLGQNSKQTAYIYLDEKPDPEQFKSTPTHYILD